MDLTKSSPHRKPMRLRLPRIGIIRPRRASIIPQSQYPPYLPLPVTFDAFFETTTGKKPYDYQCRLACGPDAKAGDPDTLQSGAACESHLINIPTGLGKTAAVVLAWLWNRVVHPDAARRDAWPRRLAHIKPKTQSRLKDFFINFVYKKNRLLSKQKAGFLNAMSRLSKAD